MSTTERRTVSRRSLLVGAAGAGTLALAGCGPDSYTGTGVFAPRVPQLPKGPDDTAWDAVPVLAVPMGPQNLVNPQKLTPAVTQVLARAVHDGERIAFRVEWEDADAQESTVRVDDFRDACAVLLAAGAADAALRTMGSADVPATLLHWKADWQRDVDSGRQGLDETYPNRTADAYPPLWDVAPADVDIEAYERHGATPWLPGVHVANPLSLATRTSPVEKLVAYGFSTTTTLPTQNALGRGVRTASGWQVMLSKPLDAADDGELAVRPLTTLTCAFAVWSGGAHDAGSRKTPSVSVHALDLAP
jgi:hypothetical protein